MVKGIVPSCNRFDPSKLGIVCPDVPFGLAILSCSKVAAGANDGGHISVKRGRGKTIWQL